MSNKITIKVTESRIGLTEGRTYNMGFGFLKAIDDDNFETVSPISTCKDYLNDVVYCEHVDTRVTVYGLTYEKVGLFGKSNKGYLAIKMCTPVNQENNESYKKLLETDSARLEKNYKNIQKLLNWIEDRLSVEKTQIEKANDGMFLVIFDKYWYENTYLISLFALLLRMGQFYNGDMDEQKFINSYKENLDITLWNQCKLKLYLLLKGIPIKQTLNKNTGANIHSMGIAYYNDFTI